MAGTGMASASVRRVTQDSPQQSQDSDARIVLPAEHVKLLRTTVPAVADTAVAAIIEEVPSYDGALSGQMGEVITKAVQLALGGFLTLASRHDLGGPPPAAIEAAYQLGRGEARSGRTMEALLAAYRIGARVSWRDMSRVVVENGVDVTHLARFAELVFAYIDALSAASVSGHSDELESSGRLLQRNRNRLARALIHGTDPEAIYQAAERAAWQPPGKLTAVVLPESQVAAVLTSIDPQTLHSTDEVPDLPPGLALLLVPSSGQPGSRNSLLQQLRHTDAVVGPDAPWLEVSASYARALRCVALELEGFVDSDEHLAEIVLSADPTARDDLRARILAPLDELRPSAAEKLTETLRSWLLHHGRREAVAEALFVHPQTVRYRMGQLREVYGDQLDDPQFVLEATLALA
jgi:hypothetical protein